MTSKDRQMTVILTSFDRTSKWPSFGISDLTAFFSNLKEDVFFSASWKSPLIINDSMMISTSRNGSNAIQELRDRRQDKLQRRCVFIAAIDSSSSSGSYCYCFSSFCSSRKVFSSIFFYTLALRLRLQMLYNTISRITNRHHPFLFFCRYNCGYCI